MHKFSFLYAYDAVQQAAMRFTGFAVRLCLDGGKDPALTCVQHSLGGERGVERMVRVSGMNDSSFLFVVRIVQCL